MNQAFVLLFCVLSAFSVHAAPNQKEEKFMTFKIPEHGAHSGQSYNFASANKNARVSSSDNKEYGGQLTDKNGNAYWRSASNKKADAESDSSAFSFNSENEDQSSSSGQSYNNYANYNKEEETSNEYVGSSMNENNAYFKSSSSSKAESENAYKEFSYNSGFQHDNKPRENKPVPTLQVLPPKSNKKSPFIPLKSYPPFYPPTPYIPSSNYPTPVIPYLHPGYVPHSENYPGYPVYPHYDDDRYTYGSPNEYPDRPYHRPVYPPHPKRIPNTKPRLPKTPLVSSLSQSGAGAGAYAGHPKNSHPVGPQRVPPKRPQNPGSNGPQYGIGSGPKSPSISLPVQGPSKQPVIGKPQKQPGKQPVPVKPQHLGYPQQPQHATGSPIHPVSTSFGQADSESEAYVYTDGNGQNTSGSESRSQARSGSPASPPQKQQPGNIPSTGSPKPQSKPKKPCGTAPKSGVGSGPQPQQGAPPMNEPQQGISPSQNSSEPQHGSPGQPTGSQLPQQATGSPIHPAPTSFGQANSKSDSYAYTDSNGQNTSGSESRSQARSGSPASPPQKQQPGNIPSTGSPKPQSKPKKPCGTAPKSGVGSGPQPQQGAPPMNEPQQGISPSQNSSEPQHGSPGQPTGSQLPQQATGSPIHPAPTSFGQANSKSDSYAYTDGDGQNTSGSVSESQARSDFPASPQPQQGAPPMNEPQQGISPSQNSSEPQHGSPGQPTGSQLPQQATGSPIHPAPTSFGQANSKSDSYAYTDGDGQNTSGSVSESQARSDFPASPQPQQGAPPMNEPQQGISPSQNSSEPQHGSPGQPTGSQLPQQATGSPIHPAPTSFGQANSKSDSYAYTDGDGQNTSGSVSESQARSDFPASPPQKQQPGNIPSTGSPKPQSKPKKPCGTAPKSGVGSGPQPQQGAPPMNEPQQGISPSQNSSEPQHGSPGQPTGSQLPQQATGSPIHPAPTSFGQANSKSDSYAYTDGDGQNTSGSVSESQARSDFPASPQPQQGAPPMNEPQQGISPSQNSSEPQHGSPGQPTGSQLPQQATGSPIHPAPTSFGQANSKSDSYAYTDGDGQNTSGSVSESQARSDFPASPQPQQGAPPMNEPQQGISPSQNSSEPQHGSPGQPTGSQLPQQATGSPIHPAPTSFGQANSKSDSYAYTDGDGQNTSGSVSESQARSDFPASPQPQQGAPPMNEPQQGISPSQNSSEPQHGSPGQPTGSQLPQQATGSPIHPAPTSFGQANSKSDSYAYTDGDGQNTSGSVSESQARSDFPASPQPQQGAPPMNEPQQGISPSQNSSEPQHGSPGQPTGSQLPQQATGSPIHPAPTSFGQANSKSDSYAYTDGDGQNTSGSVSESQARSDFPASPPQKQQPGNIPSTGSPKPQSKPKKPCGTAPKSGVGSGPQPQQGAPPMNEPQQGISPSQNSSEPQHGSPGQPTGSQLPQQATGSPIHPASTSFGQANSKSDSYAYTDGDGQNTSGSVSESQARSDFPASPQPQQGAPPMNEPQQGISPSQNSSEPQHGSPGQPTGSQLPQQATGSPIHPAPTSFGQANSKSDSYAYTDGDGQNTSGSVSESQARSDFPASPQPQQGAPPMNEPQQGISPSQNSSEPQHGSPGQPTGSQLPQQATGSPIHPAPTSFGQANSKSDSYAYTDGDGQNTSGSVSESQARSDFPASPQPQQGAPPMNEPQQGISPSQNSSEPQHGSPGQPTGSQLPQQATGSPIHPAPTSFGQANSKSDSYAYTDGDGQNTSGSVSESQARSDFPASPPQKQQPGNIPSTGSPKPQSKPKKPCGTAPKSGVGSGVIPGPEYPKYPPKTRTCICFNSYSEIPAVLRNQFQFY